MLKTGEIFAVKRLIQNTMINFISKGTWIYHEVWLEDTTS